MKHRFSFAILALLATAGTSRAQWLQTTYSLKGGWNAIYLHGDASYAATPEVLFPNSGVTANVIEVWRWNARSNQGQFSSSPLIPAAGSDWSVWKRGKPEESKLSIISGQTAYLVKCSGSAAATFDVPIKQRAMPPAAAWVRSGANLLGFPSKLTANYPSFASYFQAFPAATAANAKIYKYVGGDLGPANPLQVFSPALELLDRNRAYWFEAEVVGSYYAPLDVSLTSAAGIDFGRTGSVITARVRNTTAAPMTLTLTPAPSLPAPAGQEAVTGDVPLMKRTLDAGTASWVETPITAAYTEVIGPNSTVELNFGINRAAMSAVSNTFYASLLRLTDSGNLFEINLPVSARSSSMAGLWVGDATVTNVSSQVQSTATATAVLTNGVLTGIKVTGGGFGYGFAPVPVIASPAGVQATAVAAIAPGEQAVAAASVAGGQVTDIAVTTAGTGYITAPAITIAPPAAGTTATATALVSGGVITGITIVNPGAGYTAAPAITIGAPAQVVSGLTFTNPGSGYPIAPTVTLSSPLLPGFAATARTSVSNGVLTGLFLTNRGAGYTVAPAVTISAPPAATAQAVATSTISGGTVTSVSVTNPGLGYYEPPDVTVAPPASGTAATAIARVNNGRITGITVLDGGSGYAAAPAITIDAPPPRTTATAAAIIEDGKVTGFTISNGGSGYLADPAITIPAPIPPGSATARTPPLRMILHVADNGTARLLSQVFMGKLTSGLPGLCTKESGLDAAGKANASRIVSAHLPLDRVISAGSGSVAPGQTLERIVTIPFDDDTNPFVHRYHPDHDNKDARGRPLDAGVESCNITRTLRFEFTAAPPPGVSVTGWGSTSIGGTYTEIIKGLHKQNLTVSGTFVLRRASETGALTTN